MSFKFGSFDSESLGLIATLRDLPAVQGLQLETLDSPGSDGLILGSATRARDRFVFDVIIKGQTVLDAHTKRDAVTLALDPARGEQWLSFDVLPGWRWHAILGSVIEWRRVTWDAGSGFQFRADITFDALEGYGRLVQDEEWELLGPGRASVSRLEGNARSFPKVEIEGQLSSSEKVTVSIGDFSTDVQGPLLVNERLVLDWDNFDFARWRGDKKVASALRGMSSLDRPVLWPGQEEPFELSTDAESAFGPWSEKYRNYFLNPGAISSALFGFWSGSLPNAGSGGVVSAQWSRSGGAYRYTWTNSQFPGSGTVGAIFRDATPGEIFTMAYKTVASKPGILQPLAISTGSATDPSTVIDRSPGAMFTGDPVTQWITFVRSPGETNSARWVTNLTNRSHGDWAEISEVDLYPGEYDPNRDWVWGNSASENNRSRSRWLGAENNSESVFETRIEVSPITRAVLSANSRRQ